MSFWSVIGMVVVILTAWRFLLKIGSSLPVLEFLLLIAGLQWIIGPINSYGSSAQHYKYYMYVPETTYMSYVVPAFVLFVIIVLLKKKTFFDLSELDFQNYTGYGKSILLIGIVVDVLSSFAPPSLAFLFFLLAQFKFIGAGILLFSPSRKDRFLFFAAIGYLFVKSLGSAMFHDLLIWGIFMFMLWAIKHKPSFQVKLGVILLGVILSVGIQMVKGPYREAVWNGYKGDKLALFSEILEKRLDSGYLEEDVNQENLNVRLNQGWIISAVMHHTPSVQPFAKGTTFTEAIYTSLVPRFLDSSKKLANGRENFLRYTGVPLSSGAAMGISIIGEAYANFGIFGGILFMIFWGWFLAVYWNSIVQIVRAKPMLLFFIPLIFLQVIKAESEMLSVLNHLFKSSLLVLLFYVFSSKVLKWDWKSTENSDEEN